MDLRKINLKPEPMGPSKTVRLPRSLVNRKKMSFPGVKRDYLKEELKISNQFGAAGFGNTGKDGES